MIDAAKSLAPAHGVAFISLQLLAPILGGGTPPADGENWDGDVPFITPPDLNGLDGQLVKSWGRTLTEKGASNGSTLLHSGVLFSCRAPIGHVGTTESMVSFNQGCKGLPVTGNVDARYLAYCLVAGREALNALGNGTTFTEISARSLGSFKVPWPVSPERRRIIDYLNRETVEIDGMLAELDRLVERLRERRRGTASSLHTLGHNSRRLKWLLMEVDDRAGGRARELPLLSVSIHYGVQLRDDSTSKQAASADLSHYKLALQGDVVLNRMRAFQGGLGVAPVDGLVSPDYSVLRVDPDQLTSSWAEYVMRSPEFVDAMSSVLRGIGSANQGNVRTPRINVRDLLDLSIPLPSVPDQERLVAELDERAARVDEMIALAQRLKVLLAERRTTLITEVVTGAKEVPS